MSLTTESSLPWPHHRSLLFGCDRVNGGNYWQGDLPAGQIISTGPKLGKCTPTSVEILDTCEWKKPDGPVVMKDTRKITVSVAGPRLRLIDWDIEWTAVADVTVEKTNHSLFSIRAAADVTPWGGGTLVNAEGLAGEKATFGKPSAWCDFSGKRKNVAGDVVEGIAILDHPQEPLVALPVVHARLRLHLAHAAEFPAKVGAGGRQVGFAPLPRGAPRRRRQGRRDRRAV